MKKLIKKILKEQDEELKERFLLSMRSLQYIIESLIKSRSIEEIEFVDIEFYEKYKSISAAIKVKSYCEDPDFGELTSRMNEVENEIYRVLKNYEFSVDGKLKKVDGGSFIMMFPVKVNWESGNGDLLIEFYLQQDDFREIG